MQTIQTSYRGLSLIMSLNWDRVISIFTIFGALMVGAWIGSL